jgi:LmbE family N-acetylglucosaminyl deacetylase
VIDLGVPEALHREVPQKLFYKGKTTSGGDALARIDYVGDEEGRHQGVRLTKVKVQGLDPHKVITFTRADAMVYTAVDHHSDYEIVVDLNRANEITPAVQAMIDQGFRYLWFNDGNFDTGDPGKFYFVDAHGTKVQEWASGQVEFLN